VQAGEYKKQEKSKLCAWQQGK